MRYGLIGCGNIGFLRAEALRELNDQYLVSATDVEIGRVAALCSRYGCNRILDWQDLISSADIDAVVVSTPPSTHKEICLAALRAGKHVICEKPLVRTPEEGRQILQTVEESGLYLATGFNFRFYPPILKAREVLDAGEIGDIIYVRSYSGISAKEHSQDWMHDFKEMGGGTLRDNGIHLIDLTSYFLGGVDGVKGYASNTVWKFPGCEDNGYAVLKNSSGRYATLHSSWTEWEKYKFLIDIYGTRGEIHISCFPMITQVSQVNQKTGKVSQQKYNFRKVFIMEHLRSYRWIVVESFKLEFESFVQAISGKSTPIGTALDGVRAVEIAATISNEDGQKR